jgi:hemoglobin/transferrin/lactoferrin receptor protein
MNKLLKYYINLFALLCFSVVLSAQTQSVTVVEFGSNKPIEGAYIISSDGQQAATTDENGQATFSGLTKPFELTIQHPTYENTTVTDEDLVMLYDHIYMSRAETTLPTFTIRANRLREKYDEVSNDVDLIKPKDLQFQQPANSGDLLTASPKVYVQKSQLGGGSPVLRGFEANKVMLVIDGLKMNNAIYRSGHVQNVLTIDHNIVDQVEVIFGPGSLVYGSDALGGVMHFHTRDPQFGLENDLLWKFNAHSQYASAYNGRDYHADVAVGSERVAYLASLSVLQYNDLRIGTRRSHGDEHWGRRYQYVERIDGVDQVIDSDDPEIMRFSGFDQYDLTQKLRVRIGEDLQWFTNMQYSTSTDIPRFDRLNDVDDEGLPRFAEWSYGPQRRLMIMTGLRSEKITRLHDQLNLSLAYQQIDESRLSRRRNSVLRTERLEALDIYTINLDLNKTLSAKHSLQYRQGLQ